MMTEFTGFQYLLIDLANHWGLDKDTFEDRIAWAENNLPNIEWLMEQRMTNDIANGVPNDKRWKEAPLFHKAVLAIRRAQRGEPIGHLVGFDACCSGLQIMSVLTGCITGATAVGLVDPTVRADAYSELRDVMANLLGGAFDVSRRDAKDALMTVFYGSKEQPKKIFGEDTPELAAFYEAAQQMAPGAWDLLQTLLASWQPYALMHSWQLPDGFEAKVKVMEKQQVRIEVDELDHATFTYDFYENVGTERGLSNAANVVHSVDGYVLRCIHRRCNYDRQMVEQAKIVIDLELEARDQNAARVADPSGKVAYYMEQYRRSGMADIVILPYITMGTGGTGYLDTGHLQALASIIESMLVHEPFPVVTVHDEFRAHPDNLNYLRQHYNNVLAEIAESNLLSDLLSQIHGIQGTFPKLSSNLGSLIRSANYALS